MTDGRKVYANQHQFVVKANELIRNTRYNLTLQQQKIILFAISKIKPHDDPHTTYELSIDELCDTCGIPLDEGGFYYRAIKNDLVKLTQRLWVEMPDKRETTVSWISDAEIIPLSGTVYITFHKAMMPYLFELTKNYTQYHLQDVLFFKSKYSIRLYELLKSYVSWQSIEDGKTVIFNITLKQLRHMLDMGDKYLVWGEFNRNVVRKSVDEINAFNEDFFVEYKPLKGESRGYDSIQFSMGPLPTKHMLEVRENRRNKGYIKDSRNL